MAQIPPDFRRITEDRIDAIFFRHLSSRTGLAIWLFGKAFTDCKLISVDSSALRKDHDHRRASGNPLAFGETDVEVIATIKLSNGNTARVGLLIEDKIDARQGENQGPRYRARSEFRQQTGSWDEFKCILVAPQRYLDNAYSAGDFRDHGWDALIALEDIAQVLRNDRASLEDIETLVEAVELTNAWNKPIPSAVQFWKELSLFQRAFHPDVPIFINRQQGAGINVWPSFYENQLRNNKREIRRKYIQLVHSGKSHLSLFVKNVRYEAFLPVVSNLIEPDMVVGDEGESWQSIQLLVPEVDPCLSVESQTEKLDQIFIAARRLYQFFIKNEIALLSIPKFE